MTGLTAIEIILLSGVSVSPWSTTDTIVFWALCAAPIIGLIAVIIACGRS